jgi:hypothetical protein
LKAYGLRWIVNATVMREKNKNENKRKDKDRRVGLENKD